MSNRKGVLSPQEARKASRGRLNAARLLALAAMAMLLWPQPADAAAWYSNLWTYRKAITIDHTQVPSTQTNFPVLINLSDSNLSAHARGDGFDILFTSSDGVTKIAYEREKYASGALVAWVLVASLSSTTDTVLYMYYGNAGAADQQDITQAVWDVNYVGVWHLKEATGATSADSASSNNGTPANSPPQTTGQIGGGLSFNGTTQEDNVASTFGLGTANVTIETWAYLSSASLNGAFIKIGGTSPNAGYALGVGGSDFDGAGNNFLLLYEGVRWIPTGVSLGTGWHHAVMVIDGSGNPSAFLDGQQVPALPAGAPAAPASSITHIGGYTSSTPTNRHFNGILDEVRISNSVRSAAWIKTEYNNQSSPGTFYSVSVGVSSAWYNAAWTRRRPITIDHTKVSNTDQSSFPVLINLASDSGLSAHARSDGFDILFTSSDGVTQIPYEREKYTSGTGALVAWVKVPTVSHLAPDTVVYMYYGNPVAIDQQQRTSVWDSNYKIVYHMGDAGPTTAADSTTNANNGTQTGSVTFGAAGDIDGATAYSGGKYISVASAPSIGATSSFTYETWVLVTSFTANTNITSADGSYWIDRTTATNPLVSLVPVGGQFGYQTRYDDTTGLGGPVGGTIPAGTVWTHIAMVRDFNTAFRLYVNGLQVATTPDTGSKALTPPIPKLGRHATSATQWLNGSLDEFRVSNIARSADWIKTEYNNQSSPGTFHSLGGEQTFSAVGGGEQVRPRIQIL